MWCRKLGLGNERICSDVARCASRVLKEIQIERRKLSKGFIIECRDLLKVSISLSVKLRVVVEQKGRISIEVWYRQGMI